MTREEIKIELDKLKIDYKEMASKADLEAMLPSIPPTLDPTPPIPPSDNEEGLKVPDGVQIIVKDADVPKNRDNADDNAVDIMDKFGNYIRAYSRVRHGEDYLILADKYIKKSECEIRGFRIVPAVARDQEK